MLSECRTEAEVVEMFRAMSDEYDKSEKDEALMVGLTDFMLHAAGQLGPDFMQMVISELGVTPLFADTSEFLPEFTRITGERIAAKMDEYEQKEADLLFHAIWDRHQRAEITCEMFDWDKDEEMHIEYVLPRDDREEPELRRICNMMVYNRGSMVIRFYARRGLFEIAGVAALNGTGEWSCFSEYELIDCLGGLDANEKAICLPKGENTCARILRMPS